MMVPSELISSGATSACLLCFEGKPRGIRCARKLRVHRREALWADKDVTCTAVKRQQANLTLWSRGRITRRPTWEPSTSATPSEERRHTQSGEVMTRIGQGCAPCCSREVSCQGHRGGEDRH